MRTNIQIYGENKMKRLWSAKMPSGFTLIELLVVVAVIAVLIAILLPALSNARQMARQIACAANMKTFGLAEAMYTEDNHGAIPPGQTQIWSYWDYHLMGGNGTARYLLDVNMFRCPADTTPACPVQESRYTLAKRSYSANAWMHGDFNAFNNGTPCWPPKRLSDIERPSTTMSIVDSWNRYNTCFYSSLVTVFIPRHFDENGHQNFSQVNELYFDGRVKSVRFDEYIPIPGQMNPADGLWWTHYWGF
jgi:prepilin-type N-terminal cleavage/methylation domain-containing protein